jgi:chromosome segregation ATPase
VDYFSPGLRELVRKSRRQYTRLRVFGTRRALAKAETQLGLLGWQQADYDHETQRQVNQIEEVEREQANLTNDAAALGVEIRTLQAEREAHRKKYEEECRAIEAARKQVLAPHDQIERQLMEKRKIEPKFERRIPELDRELREVQRRYTELLQTERETPKLRQEMIHLRERSVAIPNEKSDLRTQHLRTVSEIRNLELALQKESQAIAALDQRSQQLDDDWEAQDRDFVNVIRTKERQKERMESQIQLLEIAKVNPYQRIGQVLADSDIAPMNQPDALTKVKELRAMVDELNMQVAESLVTTAREDSHLLRTSFWLWGAIAAGLLVIVLAAVY